MIRKSQITKQYMAQSEAAKNTFEVTKTDFETVRELVTGSDVLPDAERLLDQKIEAKKMDVRGATQHAAKTPVDAQREIKRDINKARLELICGALLVFCSAPIVFYFGVPAVFVLLGIATDPLYIALGATVAWQALGIALAGATFMISTIIGNVRAEKKIAQLTQKLSK